MRCAQCGASATHGRRFCGQCGAALPWSCRSCNAVNPADSRFCGDCGAAAPSAEVSPQRLAERRQLTVMFCDMVGSTELGARLDPEDLREVMGAYHNCVTSCVAEAGGFIARYMGDGILAYFGYPAAREDDPERAVRAGLDAAAAVYQLGTLAGPPGTLRSRIGIATGLVVVGDLIGSGAAQEQAVVGDTPNLAARLQASAEPGSVVIADSTHRLTGGLFEYRSLPPITMRGYSTPVRAWTVLRANNVVSRFEALRAGVSLPLLGRDDQLALLRRRWEQARDGEGHVVLLSGEAGIGKSRLIAALQQHLADEPHTRIHFFCSPQHQDSALHPLIGHLGRSAGFGHEDDPDTRLGKLKVLLASTETSQDDMALFAHLLSLPLPDGARLSELTPQRRKELTFGAILRNIEATARDVPVLVVIEDLHWADQTSLDLLERLIEALPGLPVLVVVGARPEVQPEWSREPHVSVQLLNRLDRRQAAMLIDGVSGDARLSDSVRDQIIAHADGIPLFVEELTKAVLESGLPDRAGGALVSGGHRGGPLVPSSLQASLMARLDRLGHVKEIAQMGAVIGRDFTPEQLQTVFQLPRERTQAGVQALIAADLIVERGRSTDLRYSFKHALVQDAAYGTLLRERRRTLHLQVAEALERTPGAEEDLLAYHFAEAGLAARAIEHHLKAAERASGRGALAEMVSHLRRGLGLLKSLPETHDTRRQELSLQIALGRGLIDNLGSAADEGQAAYARARALCIELDDTERLLPILYGLQVYHFTHAEPQKVIGYGREILEIGQRTSDRRALILGERVLGSAYLLLGRFQECRLAYERLIDLYSAMPSSAATAETPRDDLVAGSSFLSICLTVIGQPVQGAAVHERGLRHAERLQHAISLQFSLRRGCIQRMLVRDVAGVQAMSARLLVVASDYETFLGGPEGQFFHNWALLHAKNDPTLHQRMMEALNQLDRAKTWALLPYLMTAAAELRLSQGDRDGACALLSRAADLAQRGDERWSGPELRRVRALMLGHDFDARIALLSTALDEAIGLGAALWRLRIALDLAHALIESGDREQARAVLVAACDAVAEGEGLPEWREAALLIAQLA